MNTPIYDETPAWLVDWVNKVFTVLNNISAMDDVYIWGAPYRKLSYKWNIITLQEAPPIWAEITVDYFYSVDVYNPVNNVLFIDVINEIYDYIWQQKTSNTYKLDVAKRNINQFIKKITNSNVYNNVIRQYCFNNISKSVTAKWYIATWVTIWEDMTNVPSSWAALVWWILFNYNSYSNWVLLWTVWTVYKSWDIVNIWYKLPASLHKISEVFIDDMELYPKDYRRYTNYDYNYTIITDNNWDRYLFLPYWNYSVVTIKYLPVNWMLVNDDDIVNFPIEYTDVISLYVAYTMLMTREDDRWNNYKKEYNERKKNYLSYLWRTTVWIRNEIRSNILTNF